MYYPDTDVWERMDGTDPSAPALGAAAKFALAHESDWPASLHLPDGRYIGTAYAGDLPPHDVPLGVVRPRGPASGLVLRHGRIAVAWGDIYRPDTTFSVAKSYLALLCGIAVADGLIRSIDDPVAAAALPGDDGFASAQNREITWRHLLQQTSEWQGTLWDIPDTVDHHRHFGAGEETRRPGATREVQRPGTRWEYNDVRVNRLALSLTQVFRQSLPEVLRERVMDPIGASPSWEWHGYRNSTFTIDGRTVASVSGGGHWGGGLFISAADQARVGLLVLRRGRWRKRQLIPETWIDQMLTPSERNPQYGYLWWLNTGRQLYDAAADSSVFAMGGGYHLVWLDAGLDLVMVARWIDRDHCNALIARVLDGVA
jgi:CubicO group peptidase (beta-lactamase class C family)